MSGDLTLWSDTPARNTIVDFVTRVTDPDHDDFVPVEERIATFDNDGTLWCEQPVVQGGFIIERLASMAKSDPSLQKTQPWQSAYARDPSWIQNAFTKHYEGDDSDVKVLLEGVLKAFGEMTVEKFAAMTLKYFETARHPTYGCSYLEVAFSPMVELLGYLETNGFTTYIVSGGGRDFMRPITEQVYGIPPERVVGSSPTLTYKEDDQGSHIMRGAGMDIFDDGPGKAVQIWERIGRRPILAAGNANGDIPMLQYAESDTHPTLRLLVHHDDGEREVSYTAGAEKAMKLAAQQGWTVISMKNDWREVFSFQSE